MDMIDGVTVTSLSPILQHKKGASIDHVRQITLIEHFHASPMPNSITTNIIA